MKYDAKAIEEMIEAYLPEETGHQKTVIPTTGAAGANPGINLHALIVHLETIFHRCQQRLYIYA